MEIEKRLITCKYCKKTDFDDEFVIYQYDMGVCRDCSKNNVSYKMEYKKKLEKLNEKHNTDDLKKKLETRMYDVENMMKYLEENSKEKAIYNNVDFEKLYRELNKEILRLGHLESA